MISEVMYHRIHHPTTVRCWNPNLSLVATQYISTECDRNEAYCIMFFIYIEEYDFTFSSKTMYNNFWK